MTLALIRLTLFTFNSLTLREPIMSINQFHLNAQVKETLIPTFMFHLN